MNRQSPLALEINLRTKGLGIVIDGSDLTLAAVHNKFNNLRMHSWERLSNYPALTDEEVIEFIDDFRGRGKVKRGDVVLLVPRSEAVVQFAEFPLEAAGSLQETVEYQLGNFFPGNLEERQFFPVVISKTDQLRVMIIGLRQAYLEEVFDLCRKWKLKLAGMSLSTLGLANGLAKSQPAIFSEQKPVVFQFYPNGMEIMAFNKGRLMDASYFEFEEEPDPESLTVRLEEAFSRARVDPNEAGPYLWVGDVPETLDGFLAGELCFPKDTWLDGTGEAIESQGLAAFGAGVTALHEKLLFNLNLLPEKMRKRHKRLPLILASMVLSLFLIYFAIGEYRSFTEMKVVHSLLSSQLSQVKARAFEVSDARHKMEAAQEERAAFRAYQTKNMILKLVHMLSQELPDNTYLTNLQVKSVDRLTLQGESEDPYQTQRILSRLPYLTDVQPGNAITSGRNKDGKKRFMFKATLKLEALR